MPRHNKALYFTAAELRRIHGALDDLLFLDGQTHKYTKGERANAESALNKVTNEMIRRDLFNESEDDDV
jgi:hypothetical protein